MSRTALLLISLSACLPVFIAACAGAEPCPPNVQITLIEIMTDRPVTGNTIEIYGLQPDGSITEEPITSARTDDLGAAQFCLLKGVYRALPAGSFAGAADFSLSKDDQNLNLTLTVQPVLN